MWISTPETVSKVMWEGELVVSDDEGAIERAGGHGAARPTPSDLPIVTIGEPEVWPLKDVWRKAETPPEIWAKLGTNDFFLVRCCWSSRVRHERTRLEFARFQIDLQKDGKHQPIAYDMHPRMVTVEIKRKLEVALNPSLKFHEVEASAVKAGIGIEYSELQPQISAAGVGESCPSWDFEAPKGTILKGARFVHLLVRTPKGTRDGQAQLNLTADVRHRESLWSAVLGTNRETVGRSLTAKLW